MHESSQLVACRLGIMPASCNRQLGISQNRVSELLRSWRFPHVAPSAAPRALAKQIVRARIRCQIHTLQAFR